MAFRECASNFNSKNHNASYFPIIKKSYGRIHTQNLDGIMLIAVLFIVS